MIFISHISEPDHEIALKIAGILKKNGISYWIAPESIRGGDDFSKLIPDAINGCEIFLLVLTENTARSAHVRKELMLAISHRKPVLPLKIGNFTIEDTYEYLLADIQIIPFSFTEEDTQMLVERCKRGERVVEMDLNKNPRRTLYMVRGDYQDNMDHIIREKPEILDRTVFAAGIDRSSRLDISSNGGILKWVCRYLAEEYGISLETLQSLVDQAKMEQLGHASKDQPLSFRDIVVIKVPLPISKERPLFLQLLFIANSQKKKSYYASNNVDEVEGIDSREIILSVFNKCRALGDSASGLFIGAMGTNGLAFPYEVVTSEILNCFVYAQRVQCSPRDLYYSVRQTDMEKSGLTMDEILSYVSTVGHFFRD
ncbi:MAG: toll/interleukin-1 receptor domain-containing protein [Lachnospiraceae bacterium]|nr:toll/interleukin-1 receptor domain-containing protein [Lachnospiraceae bacterium]